MWRSSFTPRMIFLNPRLADVVRGGEGGSKRGRGVMRRISRQIQLVLPSTHDELREALHVFTTPMAPLARVAHFLCSPH